MNHNFRAIYHILLEPQNGISLNPFRGLLVLRRVRHNRRSLYLLWPHMVVQMLVTALDVIILSGFCGSPGLKQGHVSCNKVLGKLINFRGPAPACNLEDGVYRHDHKSGQDN